MAKNKIYFVVQTDLTSGEKKQSIILATTPKGALIKFNKLSWKHLAIVRVYDNPNDMTLLYESKVN